MKKITIFSFILTFLWFIPITFAQIQFYGIQINPDENGECDVKLVITFEKPEKILSFDIIGRIENLTAFSSSGPINCNVEVKGISSVTCEFNLTEKKRTVELSFKTRDFIRTLDSKYFFATDLSLNKNISSVSVSLKLPEGMVLAGENITESKISFPENATAVSDGRRIIIFWKLSNIKATQPLRFQVLYERIISPPTIRTSHIIILGLVIASVLGVFYVKYFRKPEKVVLSVLDEYERKVMNSIIASGGETTQKKVVRETNLSKAKVSRVVKDLVSRGLIEVERIGRTNRLKLVKKKLKF